MFPCFIMQSGRPNGAKTAYFRSNALKENFNTFTTSKNWKLAYSSSAPSLIHVMSKNIKMQRTLKQPFLKKQKQNKRKTKIKTNIYKHTMWLNLRNKIVCFLFAIGPFSSQTKDISNQEYILTQTEKLHFASLTTLNIRNSHYPFPIRIRGSVYRTF